MSRGHDHYHLFHPPFHLRSIFGKSLLHCLILRVYKINRITITRIDELLDGEEKIDTSLDRLFVTVSFEFLLRRSTVSFEFLLFWDALLSGIQREYRSWETWLPHMLNLSKLLPLITLLIHDYPQDMTFWCNMISCSIIQLIVIVVVYHPMLCDFIVDSPAGSWYSCQSESSDYHDHSGQRCWRPKSSLQSGCLYGQCIWNCIYHCEYILLCWSQHVDSFQSRSWWSWWDASSSSSSHVSDLLWSPFLCILDCKW